MKFKVGQTYKDTDEDIVTISEVHEKSFVVRWVDEHETENSYKEFRHDSTYAERLELVTDSKGSKTLTKSQLIDLIDIAYTKGASDEVSGGTTTLHDIYEYWKMTL